MLIRERTFYEVALEKTKPFLLHFEPVDEDYIKIIPIDNGTKIIYITQDENPDSPDVQASLSWADDKIFLVHYHRDFWVDRPSLVSKDEIADWYHRQAGEAECDPESDLIDNRYYIFPVAAYIHSGVYLSLGHSFRHDPGGWDTSHVGAVLASKHEFPSEEEACKAAESLIESWNTYLSGDVYGIVEETFENNRMPSDDFIAVWDYYGFDSAKADWEDRIERLQ